ncbi:thiamine kinase [Superficieibacter sp.]|uniref:thiamine kinase n=1 Tax=Superficieibacter sp. TaxID=2303322 RepID=UPI0028AD20C4|nr:thiamine kinase [Superficieibacter sp.]
MPFSNSKLTRDQLLARFFPGFRPAAPQAHCGLSGGSGIIEKGQQRYVLRQHHDPHAPEFHFLRQYHLLRRLPATLAPAPIFYTPGWMVVDYLPGEVKTTLPDSRPLAQVLYHLHQQPRYGWPVTLMPLLESYWQHCSPARRTLLWLRLLTRLRKQGQPAPLRLAPLHMDVHPGNIVHTANGLRLIDWEYAGDGDVALELASVWADEHRRRKLVAEYAAVARIPPDDLWWQVQRLRPWVLMLMAGWYECRWQQTGDGQFVALADDVWNQLKIKQQER